ncbi:MAG: polysaccharide pyruvyl transferase CsaB [Clostridia bacterium]
MRPLHLISGGDTGGAKTHVLTLISALAQETEVKLVCLMDGPFYREALEMGLPVVLSEQRSRTDLSAIRRLRDIVDDMKPDLIHCHGARANFLGALLRRGITDIPFVSTIHSDYRRDFEGNLYKHLVYSTLNALSLRSFDHYLAITENFRGMLIDRGFPGGRVHTVYNGLDFDNSPTVSREEIRAFRCRHGIPEDTVLVGLVARMARIKRHDILLEAAAIGNRRGCEAHYVLVGDGEQRRYLEKLSAKLNIEDKVHFTGHLEDTDVALAALDVNVLPSESESFPYVLLEGALHGVATVATPVGGIPELIRHADTGYLTEIGNPRDLADHIQRLVASESRRRSLGSSLAKRARHRFSLEAMRAQHLDIYGRIIDGGRNPARVSVSGYFGFGNTGDEALLRGLIGGLRREKPGVDIWVLSAAPKTTARVHRVSSAPRFSPLKVLSCITRSRLLISGGGTLLQDETSLRSLIYYTAVIYGARLVGTPIMLYANGIGPLHTGIGRRLATGALRSAAAITLRDRASAGTVRTILGDIPDGARITADPAFGLKEPAGEEVDAILADIVPNRDSAPLAIISMRPWGYDARVPANLGMRAVRALRSAGFLPLLLAMQESRDLPLAKLISNMCEQEVPVLATTGMEPELVLGMMGRAHLVLGMRLHALILAAAAGSIPVGVSYDPKIDGFLSDLGAPCLGNIETITPDRLEEVLQTYVFPRLDKIREVVGKGAEKMKKQEEDNARLASTLLE